MKKILILTASLLYSIAIASSLTAETLSLENTAVSNSPSTHEISEEEIITAIKAYNLENLKKLLAHVEDVRSIVDDDTLLLHMAEEAMGISGQKNEMAAFLIQKKAYILQLDEDGKSFERFVQDWGLEGTPRHIYIKELIGDSFQRMLQALTDDSLEEIQSMSEIMPLSPQLLRYAVQKKAVHVSTWLIDQGIPVDGISLRDSQNLLHIACDNSPNSSRFEDRIPIIAALLSKGLSVNAQDAKGNTPLNRLFISCQNNVQNTMGSPNALINILIDAGADIMHKASNGKTNLHMALDAKEDGAVLILLEHGAFLDQESLESNNITLSSIKALVDAGAEPAFFTDNIAGNWTDDERNELVSYLIGHGASVADFNLVHARNDEKLLHYLVEQGADVGNSDILLASIADYHGMERIIYLMEQGADVQRLYHNNMTILHFAVRYRRKEAVSYLIEQGADINPLDKQGKTPLDYCKKGDTEIMHYLFDAGALKASEL